MVTTYLHIVTISTLLPGYRRVAAQRLLWRRWLIAALLELQRRMAAGGGRRRAAAVAVEAAAAVVLPSARNAGAG
jgi:hypothetical protein